jgi:hypothetical protein
VAADAGAMPLNNPNGTVAFPITSGATLTLFAANAGFIVPNGVYGDRHLHRRHGSSLASRSSHLKTRRRRPLGEVAAAPATVRVASR